MHGRVNAILHKETGRILVQKPMPKITCLALEGAGSAGVAFAGFFKVYEQYGLLRDVEHISGISAGAATAVAACISYTGDEIIEIMSNMPMKDFTAATESWSWTPEPLAVIRQLASNYLLIKSDEARQARERFLTWMREMIAPKMDGNGRATTRDLARKIAERKARNPDDNTYKNLIVGAIRYSQGIPGLVIFDLINSPEIELAELVLVSACHVALMGEHEWGDALWGDGGTKSIILTKVFDKAQFLPEGYGFTAASVNPGVLAVKIDTEEEIRQLWGIVENEDLDTRMKIVKKISTAALDNNNEHEMREARNVIALSDCGINRGKLDYPIDELMKLVNRAADDTREYIEDYIDAAYDIKSYGSIKEWLVSCSIEQLSALKRAYQAQLYSLEVNPDEISAREKLTQADPAKPNLSQLQSQIAFLKKYIKARVKGNADALSRIKFPEYHINILPDDIKPGWHDKVRKELENRLKLAYEKIKFAESEFQRMMVLLRSQVLAAMPHSFSDWRSEAVQKLVMYQHYIGNMRRERNKIENKLGIKSEHHAAPDKFKSDSYAVFYSRILGLSKESDLSSAMCAVVLKPPPVLDISVDTKVPFNVTLDFREVNDRNLYLIAAMLYLRQRGFSDAHRFYEIYQLFLPNELIAPVTSAACMELLKQDAVTAQMSMYVIENLLHYFEKCEYPYSEPAMDLKVILKLPLKTFLPVASEVPTADFVEMEFNARKNEALEESLSLVREKIRFAEQECNYLVSHFSHRVNEDAPLKFCHWRSEDVQKIILYREWANKLHRELSGLNSRSARGLSDIVDVSEKSKSDYRHFYEKMAEIGNAKDLSHALSAVVIENLPVAVYTDDTTMPFALSLDFRDPQERKLYLIAALFYLTRRGYGDTPRFEGVVDFFIPGFTVHGINAAMLMSYLQQDEIEAQVSMCIIENLMHCFEKKERPAQVPSMDLNAILGLSIAPLVAPPCRKIKGDMPELMFDARHESDGLAKATFISARLESARFEYQHKLKAYSDLQQLELHSLEFNWLQELVEYDEAIHYLERELVDVQCRAGLVCSHAPQSDSPDNFAYKVFYQKIMMLNADKNIPYALRAVIPGHLPLILFSDNSMFSCKINLDMRKQADRQVYLLAALIFLEKRGCKNIDSFKEIYRMTFPDEMSAPTTREQMSDLLNQSDALLQVSLFKIETLLHYFEKKESPKYQPALDIDNVLSVSPHSFFATPPKPVDQGCELPILFNTTGQTARPGFVMSFQAQDK